MPLPDLSLLPRVEVVTRSKTFTDKRCPGLNIELEFGFLPFQSDVDLYFYADKSKELIAKYVTGNYPVAVPGGARVPISETSCRSVAAFIAAEQATGTEAVTPAEEWFRLSLLAPDAWGDINAWYVEAEKELRGFTDTQEATDGNDPNESGAEEDLSLTPTLPTPSPTLT